MTKIYCGTKDKPPKGKRPGNMKECVRARQIRKFGLNKVDKRIIEQKGGEKPVSEMSKQELRRQIIALKAKVKKLRIEYNDEDTDEKKKPQIKQQAEKIVKQIVALQRALKTLQE